PAATLPDGFACRDELISPDEERALAERIAALDLKPFEFHGHLGKRRVVSFGFRYDYARRFVQESPPIPDFLLDLRQRAAEFASVPADGLQQVLINEYAPGAGVGWHRDKPEFEDVIAVSLLAPCRLRFRRKHGARWERLSHLVQPRSAYVLRGPARHDWEHSVPEVEALRYSVTFRNFTRPQ
ncbi:MAG: alkylated repair protein, partial [Rhodospirillales bacterium]|nr:alkylated repair protein [Rhodospirillales bacterium]